MADANLSCMVNELSELLSDEHGDNRGILEHLQGELTQLQGILRNSSPPGWKRDQETRAWIRHQITAAASDLVAVADALKHHDSSRAGIEALESPLRKLLAKIDELKMKLIGGGFGGPPRAESGGYQTEISSSNPSSLENSIVGLENEKRDVIDRLLLPIEERISISIVGIGGLGKTAFAREICSSPEIKKGFKVRAWVSMSGHYNKEEILRRLVDAVQAGMSMKEKDQEASSAGGDGEAGAMDKEKKLEKRLQELLSPKVMYLVVADDVWTVEAWKEVEKALPDHHNGSRIIFTTRLTDVASAADTAETAIPPFPLPFLSPSESEQLFLKKVYPKINEPQFPKELQKVGRMIVRKCGGLPLALVILGGLLSVKEKTEKIWCAVLDELSWDSFHERRVYDHIFSLSYNNLPSTLKPCCLHLACFPVDSDIGAARLLRLWVAEGFVPLPPEGQGMTRETTAAAFLDELLRRRIVEAVAWRIDGKVKKVQVHNLMRDFLMEEARESGFLRVAGSMLDMIAAAELASKNEGIATRSLALHFFVDPYMASSTYPYLRSLMGFNLPGESGTLCHFIDGLRFLRVVDVEAAATLVAFPREITGMVHLTYFRWISAGASPVTLPLSAQVKGSAHILLNRSPSTELQNPQKAYTKTSVGLRGLKFISEQIASSSSLKNLCNLEMLEVAPLLIGMGSDKNIQGICSLQKLRTLRTIMAAEWVETDLEKMTSLRKLGLCAGDDYLLKALPPLEKLSDQLVSLTLQSSGSRAIPMSRILRIFGGRRPLLSLKLIGPLAIRDEKEVDRLPEMLSKLTMENSGLKENPMEILGRLPSLKILRIRKKAFVGKKIGYRTITKSFPELQFLTLDGLPELEQIEVSEVPEIKRVVVRRCPKLKELHQPLLQANEIIFE